MIDKTAEEKIEEIKRRSQTAHDEATKALQKVNKEDSDLKTVQLSYADLQPVREQAG